MVEGLFYSKKNNMRIKLKIPALLVSFAALATALLNLFTNSSKMSQSLLSFFWDYPYTIILATSSICQLFVPFRVKTKSSKVELNSQESKKSRVPSKRAPIYVYRAALLILTGLALVYVYTQTNKKAPSRKPNDEIIIQREAKSSQPYILTSYTSNSVSKDIGLKRPKIRWVLLKDKCSLQDSITGDTMFIFPNKRLLKQMTNVAGTARDEPKFKPIISMLKDRCSRKERYILRNRIASCENLYALTIAYFNELSALRPSLEEYNSMDKEERDLYMYWSRSYFGQWCPFIKITVDNIKGKEAIQIHSIVYEASDFQSFEAFMGQDKQYDFGFKLYPNSGNYIWPLYEQGQEITIPKGETGELTFILSPHFSSTKLGKWDGYLKLRTSHHGDISVGRLVLTTYNNYTGYIY